MEITAAMVKELRETTGAGMMDCKRALIETNGDNEKAIEYLREKGLASAAKKAGRIAAEGIVESYIHMGGRIGVLIEVNCETDFVAKTAEYKAFVHDLAMQVAASNPLYIRREDISAADVEKEREILRAKAINEGKNEKFLDKIVDGGIEKFFKESCLLNQPFVKNPDMTVEDYVKSQIAMVGENINVRRFTRYEMGEGLVKREENFAEEIAKQTAQ